MNVTASCMRATPLSLSFTLPLQAGAFSERGSAASLENSILVDLMVRYQAADLSAGEDLVHRLSPLLLRFFSRAYYTRRHNEDLLQDFWLELHTARQTFRPESPLLPWIFGIARHLRFKAYYREHKIYSHELTMDPLPETAIVPWPEIDLRERDFIRALNLLPESQREVLFLQKLSGMSIKEIAGITSCSVGAVKQKTHRAYKTLRNLYRYRP